MKKIVAALVATTMLTGAAMASVPNHASTNGAATQWGAAGTVRDSLTTVYSDLGGTFSTANAGQEYSELLYRIDNLGDYTPVTMSVNSLGELVIVGGTSTGLFTMQDVIDQVEEFTKDLSNDLFGVDDQATDGTSNYGATFDDDGHDDNTKTTNTGLATAKLNDVIDKINLANTILTDASKSGAEKKATAAWLFGQTYVTDDLPDTLKNDDDSVKEGNAIQDAGFFNNAVAALRNITDDSVFTLGALTTADDDSSSKITGYVLGGYIVDASEAHTKSDQNHIIRDGGRIYLSYTDYVTNAGSSALSFWAPTGYMSTGSATNNGDTVEVRVFNNSGVAGYSKVNQTGVVRPGVAGTSTTGDADHVTDLSQAGWEYTTQVFKFNGGTNADHTAIMWTYNNSNTASVVEWNSANNFTVRYFANEAAAMSYLLGELTE